jgi:hypothetical protein
MPGVAPGMRETWLNKGGDRRVLRTDDQGTTLLDGEGFVVQEHGTMRHDMLLEQQRQDGWTVASDDHVAPPAATGRPPGNLAGGPPRRDATATVTDGEDA